MNTGAAIKSPGSSGSIIKITDNYSDGIFQGHLDTVEDHLKGADAAAVDHKKDSNAGGHVSPPRSGKRVEPLSQGEDMKGNNEEIHELECATTARNEPGVTVGKGTDHLDETKKIEDEGPKEANVLTLKESSQGASELRPLLELEKDAPHSSACKLLHEDVDQSLTMETCNLASGTERGLSMDMTFNAASGSEQIAKATKIVKSLPGDPAKFVVRRLILNLSTSVHAVWGELVILKITNGRGRELAIGHSPTVLSASILMDNVLFCPSLVLEILVEQYRSILQQSLMLKLAASLGYREYDISLQHVLAYRWDLRYSSVYDLWSDSMKLHLVSKFMETGHREVFELLFGMVITRAGEDAVKWKLKKWRIVVRSFPPLLSSNSDYFSSRGLEDRFADLVKLDCGMPTLGRIVLSQSEKEKEGVKEPMGEGFPVSMVTFHLTSQNVSSDNAAKDERSFTSEAHLSAVPSERETSKDDQSPIRPMANIVEGSPSTSSVCQMDPKMGNRKALKEESIRKHPSRQTQKGDRSCSVLVSLAGTGQFVQFEGLRPLGKVESSGTIPCGVVSTPTSNFPDLNTSTPPRPLHCFNSLSQIYSKCNNGRGYLFMRL
ncbi:hypothetical protein Acr_12g0006780 [Actinidia rufa]|uniref:Uncharacterized protein n=1 Tax=Actinidia rufa TaxID=165716 RepID=A0A7J0FJN1_9ERIC|nr:hypothetical protein Acr_12g0006780 [Actinidia rufa]